MKEKGAFNSLDSIKAYARRAVIEISKLPYHGSKKNEYFFRKEVSIYVSHIMLGPNHVVAEIKKNRETYLRLKSDLSSYELK